MKNSYWYTDHSIEEKNRVIKVMCVECYNLNKSNTLETWFWPGEEKGYGDYDLNCSICNQEIYKKV